MLPAETQEAEPEKTGTAIETTSVPAAGPNTNGLGVVMDNKNILYGITIGDFVAYYNDSYADKADAWGALTPEHQSKLVCYVRRALVEYMSEGIPITDRAFDTGIDKLEDDGLFEIVGE